MFDNCSHKCALRQSNEQEAKPDTLPSSPPDHEVVSIRLSDIFPASHKEKRMNTYYISARVVGAAEYVVESENEEDAIQQVEWGNVDYDTYETEIVEACEVTDVEYGDAERYGKLGLTFVTRGNVPEANIVDALYSLLQRFDGTTTQYNDAELEIIGFSVDHVDEV